jgi:hypothetical protein
MAGKAPKNPEQTWPVTYPELAVSEFTAEHTGAQSPFGDDLAFPLPVEKLRYTHPSAADRPNRPIH